MGKPYRILAVDDDPDILELLQYNLEKEGFKVVIEADGLRAVEISKRFHPDLIILDIMMPHITGIEVCRRLRQLPEFKSTYIFFLTARSEHYYQEAALDTGADDFIEKVMGLRALTNKVIHVLKRNFIIRKSVNKINLGPMQINRRAHTVFLHGEPVLLSKPEFELLFFFAQNPKKVISVEQLLSNLWGSEIYSAAPSIDTYLAHLGQKIGRQWIREVDRGQYRFSPP